MTYQRNDTPEPLASDDGPAIGDIHGATAYFDWAWNGCGLGQLSFAVHADGRVLCMNECMSRESVRAILIAFANHVADNAVLEDDPPAQSKETE